MPGEGSTYTIRPRYREMKSVQYVGMYSRRVKLSEILVLCIPTCIQHMWFNFDLHVSFFQGYFRVIQCTWLNMICNRKAAGLVEKGSEIWNSRLVLIFVRGTVGVKVTWSHSVHLCQYGLY